MHLMSSRCLAIQLLASLLCIASGLTGCNKPARTGMLPGFDPSRLLGAEHEAALSADASLASFEAGTRSLGLVEDGELASVVEMEVAASGAGQWRTEVAGQRASLMRVEGGRLLLAETTDYANKAVTTFEPPLSLIEAGMFEGRGVETTHGVTVRALLDPAKIIDRGTAEQTLVRLADQDLVLPGGRTHRAVRLMRTLTISLGRAKVNEVTTSWYVPKLGLAAEQSREEVRVLGPLGWTHEKLMVRVP
jgi:hypothetical protein